MRVIAGQFRSRKLKTVNSSAIRPTPDRLRESLFSILSSRLEGATFVDAYAGSGAVGIEALSRGAKHVVLIESSSQALAVIRENLRSLEISSGVTVVRGRAASLFGNYPADIVFLDPPYDLVNEYKDSLLALSAVHSPYVIAQHSSRLTLDETYGHLQKTRVVKQGDNSLSFFAARRHLGPDLWDHAWVEG
jgi:16S rRNA (guanine966-N2)-methyltransferase